MITGAVAGAVLVAAVSFWQGNKYGHTRCTLSHQAELLESIEAGQEAERKRIEVARERDELVRQLEVAANEDPVIVNQCLGSSRVRRLNDIR